MQLIDDRAANVADGGRIRAAENENEIEIENEDGGSRIED